MTERSFTSADGTRIVYESWGKPNGRPIVLHHGFATNRRVNWVFPRTVESLVRAGRHVVALDARGHGDSDKPLEPERYGEDVMVRDLQMLVDTLNAPEIDLVGYSMGAVVALLFAAVDARAHRLIVAGVGEGVLECGGVDQRVLPAGELARVLRMTDPGDIDVPEALEMWKLVEMTGGDRVALAAHCQSVHATPIELSRITAPALVLAGATDRLAVRPERLAEAIPRARTTLVPGDHMTAVISTEFRDAVLAFLGRGKAHSGELSATDSG